MNRQIYRTQNFDEFYNSLNKRTREKADYIFEVIRTQKIVSTKFVKKIINSDFYELRISVENEYRVIFFSIDCENFMNANEIILLNGFIKKSVTVYERQIEIAKKLMEKIDYGKD